jgi:hypothetical protein
MICNTKTNKHNNTLNGFNAINNKLNFTTEEQNNINFLDIRIHRDDKLIYNIHRKRTATRTVIHNASCHPKEQNIAAFIYL